MNVTRTNKYPLTMTKPLNINKNQLNAADSKQQLANALLQENVAFSNMLNSLLAASDTSDSADSTNEVFSSSMLMPPSLLAPQIQPYMTTPVPADISAGTDLAPMSLEANGTTSQGSLTDRLNQILNGKLKGAGDVFVAAGQKYNINPALLAAISMHETGNGTSRAANERNNIAGMMGANGLKSYSSVEESILDMARNLRQNYFDEGKQTIAEIGAKYAPVGAENDPTHLNEDWVNGVSHFFGMLNG
jgi:hypothetical protein